MRHLTRGPEPLAREAAMCGMGPQSESRHQVSLPQCIPGQAAESKLSPANVDDEHLLRP